MSDAMQHGLAKSGVYRVWIGMKGRCYSPGNPRFATHGGRGTDRPAVAAEFLGLPRLVGGTTATSPACRSTASTSGRATRPTTAAGRRFTLAATTAGR